MYTYRLQYVSRIILFHTCLLLLSVYYVGMFSNEAGMMTQGQKMEVTTRENARKLARRHKGNVRQERYDGGKYAADIKSALGKYISNAPKDVLAVFPELARDENGAYLKLMCFTAV